MGGGGGLSVAGLHAKCVWYNYYAYYEVIIVSNSTLSKYFTPPFPPLMCKYKAQSKAFCYVSLGMSVRKTGIIFSSHRSHT